MTRELTLTSIHPGVTVEQVREATGWDVKISPDLKVTEIPDADALAALRDLQARTAKAHGQSTSSEG